MKSQTINEIENIIGYAFKNKVLLERAFIHSSYAHEKNVESYDRLEFLGDGVLGLVIAEKLYTCGNDEGDMTEKRSRIVSTVPLEELSENLGLNKYILFGAGERKQTHTRRKVLADVVEAIIGGIYLDGGYEKAKDFIYKHLNDRIKEVLFGDVNENPKGALQEYCQARKLGNIEYRVLSKSGTHHEPYFVVGAFLNDKEMSRGEGSRIKEAEKISATKALKKIIQTQK
ncbi:MAG: ribonuclease III [Clostridia bacterium]|nr:ribonuclease III [Clostridia bacterium]